MTFTTAQTLDADGIKTSIATVAAITTYTTSALNGAMVTANVAYPRFNSKLDIASIPTATSSSSVGAYVAASTIVFTGTYSGVAVTRTATVGSANGNELLYADGPMDSVSSITIGAQVSTAGAWTFGFHDLVPTLNSQGQVNRWTFSSATTGNVTAGFSNGTSDVIAAVAGYVYPVALTRLYSATAVTVTIYEA